MALFLSVLFGSIGVGYFVYGRKQKRMVPLLAGLGLCGFPYLVSGTALTVLIGVVLLALPWFLRD